MPIQFKQLMKPIHGSFNLKLLEAYIAENQYQLTQAINTVQDGQSLIHLAASSNDLALFERLQEIPEIDNNITNSYLVTPLMTAIPVFSNTVAKYLLSLPNIRFNSQMDDGTTALHCAVTAHNFAIIECLQRYPTLDPNLRDSSGNTPLMKAVEGYYRYNEEKREKMVSLLLEAYNLNINAANHRGDTALHLAVKEVKAECPYLGLNVISMLLNYPGIDLTIKNKANETAGDVLYQFALKNYYLYKPQYVAILDVLSGKTRELQPARSMSAYQIKMQKRIAALPKRLTGPSFESRMANINLPDGMEIPDEYLCPISRCLMDDPRQLTIGKVYDRTSLEEFFRCNVPVKISIDGTQIYTDPMTRREIISEDELCQPTCQSLREEINSFITKLELTYGTKHELNSSHDTSFTKTLIEGCVSKSLCNNYYMNSPKDKIDLQDYIFRILQEHSEFKSWSFISLFFNKKHSSYCYRPDKLNALYDAAYTEIDETYSTASPAMQKAIDRVKLSVNEIRHSNPTAESTAEAISALWHTAFVLRHPQSVKYYQNFCRPLAGHPSPKMKALGVAMMALGVVLVAAASMAAAGTFGFAIPLALGFGISGAALVASGAGIFNHGRRAGLSKSIYQTVATLRQEEKLPSHHL